MPTSMLKYNILKVMLLINLTHFFVEGMWFLVHSNEEKESVHGFWKAKGEACKVYSDKVINGWRTTLEYFEGLAPDGQITDWLMQEYKITPKDVNDKYGQKVLEGKI